MIKIYESNELDKDFYKRVYDLVEDIVDYLYDNDIYAEYHHMDVIDNNSGYVTIYIEIDNGDWYHDHEKADYLITNKFDVLKYGEEEIGNSLSDTYDAIHYYVFKLPLTTEEATNCSSIGQHKRCSIDLIDSDSRFDIDDEEDDVEILTEEDIDDEEDNDDSDEYYYDDNIDGENSSDPIEKQQNKDTADNSISI